MPTLYTLKFLSKYYIMILYQYILFTIIGYFSYIIYLFNSFHGPDSNVIKISIL